MLFMKVLRIILALSVGLFGVLAFCDFIEIQDVANSLDSIPSEYADAMKSVPYIFICISVLMIGSAISTMCTLKSKNFGGFIAPMLCVVAAIISMVFFSKFHWPRDLGTLTYFNWIVAVIQTIIFCPAFVSGRSKSKEISET